MIPEGFTKNYIEKPKLWPLCSAPMLLTPCGIRSSNLSIRRERNPRGEVAGSQAPAASSVACLRVWPECHCPASWQCHAVFLPKCCWARLCTQERGWQMWSYCQGTQQWYVPVSQERLTREESGALKGQLLKWYESVLLLLLTRSKGKVWG